MKLSIIPVLFALAFLLVPPMSSFGEIATTELYSCDKQWDNDSGEGEALPRERINLINSTDGTLISSQTVSITLSQGDYLGCLGLATDPTNGQMYILVRNDNNGGSGDGRFLATIDPTTGIATEINPTTYTDGTTLFNPRAINFDINGQMFVLASNSVGGNLMYKIDKTTGIVDSDNLFCSLSTTSELFTDDFGSYQPVVTLNYDTGKMFYLDHDVVVPNTNNENGGVWFGTIDETGEGASCEDAPATFSSWLTDILVVFANNVSFYVPLIPNGVLTTIIHVGSDNPLNGTWVNPEYPVLHHPANSVVGVTYDSSTGNYLFLTNNDNPHHFVEITPSGIITILGLGGGFTGGGIFEGEVTCCPQFVKSGYNSTTHDGLQKGFAFALSVGEPDTTAPVISAIDSEPITLLQGSNFDAFEHVQCIDDVDGEIVPNGNFATDGGITIDTSGRGTQTQDYTCTDSSDNTKLESIQYLIKKVSTGGSGSSSFTSSGSDTLANTPPLLQFTPQHEPEQGTTFSDLFANLFNNPVGIENPTAPSPTQSAQSTSTPVASNTAQAIQDFFANLFSFFG